MESLPPRHALGHVAVCVSGLGFDGLDGDDLQVHGRLGEPFHTLPREEFLDRLRVLTNLRAVKDEESHTGYKIDYAEFTGWKDLPTW